MGDPPRAEKPVVQHGTQCNLSCKNCYIESSPTNDRLSFIGPEDLVPYLDEIQDQDMPAPEIGFTGGEPFSNPHFLSLLEVTLRRGFKVIVLTNAYRMINRFKEPLLELQNQYGKSLLVRVSLDHYSAEVHEAERGQGTFAPTLKNIFWFSENGFNLAVAGRSLTGEDPGVSQDRYRQLFLNHGIQLDCENKEKFVVFSEMHADKPAPEITTSCWEILNKSPDEIMCASSRMIVKRKGEKTTKVLSCTLLAYDKQFELGETLADSKKNVPLNHKFCSQFCVLGGSSCS